MKINWKQIRAVGLKAMGVQTLTLDEKGKEVLTVDQRSLLTSKFGSEFVTVYEGNLATLESSDGTDIQLENLLMEIGKAGATDIDGIKAELATEREKSARFEKQVQTLSEAPETQPTAIVVAGTGGAPKFKIDATAVHNKIALATMNSGRMGQFETNTIDVAELKTELGTYSSQGNNVGLMRDIYTGFSTAKFMTSVMAIESYKAARSHATSVVMEFNSKWTPAGKSKFTAIKIRNRRHKINFSIVPADVGNSWLLHLYKENMTPDQMPITRYIVQNILLPSILQDIELRMIGKGKYVETADGVAGKAEDAMDGIETILVASAKTKKDGINFYPNPVDLTKATDAEVVDYIETFAQKISPKYKSITMNIFCSADVYLKYKRGYKVKWGEKSGTEKTHFGADRVDFTNFSLQVLECLYGSPIIFCTPKSNFLLLENLNNPQVITDVQKHDYEVRYYGEFWLGTGLAIGEMVFASVPDAYDPQAAISEDGDTDFWDNKPPVAAPAEGV